MKTVLAAAVLIVAAAAAAAGAVRSGRTVAVGATDRPRYVGCQTSEECGKGACCLLGMSRFSTPQCVARRDLGQDCRPGGEPVTTTLHYPDGVSVDMADVYFVHCPCQEGLRCDGAADERSPVCADGEPTNGLRLELEDAGAGGEDYWRK